MILLYNECGEQNQRVSTTINLFYIKIGLQTWCRI